MKERGLIVFLCLLATASLLLSRISTKQFTLVAFIIAGISLALALYFTLRLRKGHFSHETTMKERGIIASLAILASALLLLSQISTDQSKGIFFFAAGIPLVLAAYLALRWRSSP